MVKKGKGKAPPAPKDASPAPSTSKTGKGKKPAGGGKKKARPGFEGSFKAKVGGKKK